MQDVINIIIPSAGQNYRMIKYGPKALIDIDGQSLLQRQMKVFERNFPHFNVNLVIANEFTKFSEFSNSCKNVKIVRNYETETGVAHSIRLGLFSDDRPTLITYGDVIYDKSIFDDLSWSQSFVIINTLKNGKDNEVGVNVLTNGTVGSMAYGFPLKWSHILYLRGEELRLFKEVVRQTWSKRCFGYEIVNKVIDAGGEFAVYSSICNTLDIDNIKDLKKARKVFKAIQ